LEVLEIKILDVVTEITRKLQLLLQNILYNAKMCVNIVDTHTTSYPVGTRGKVTGA